jgi:glycosyltransferase involved in cell wall biosynthesis
MRLMFVASALDCGGAERHTLELASELSARGHSCDLVAMQAARDDSWVRSLTDARPDDPPLRFVTLDARHQFDGHAVRRLCTELRQRQPHVVMAVNGYPLIHAARAVRAAGFAATQRPALALAFHSTRLAGVKELLQHVFVTLIARHCDQLIFVSEFQSHHWLRRGLRARRNAVIHNGVADGRFAPSVRMQWRAATRTALGFHDDDYVLGCCAQLRPEKNHVQLIDAVIALRREGLAARALIVGEGPQRLLIEGYAQAHGASAWISLVGHQDQVERYIAAFDVGVLCSVAETFSLAALEQMSMEVPVVLSEQGGAREMVSDGVQGFVFPTGDTPALVDVLRRLHPLDARARMGAQAAQQVATRFRHAHMVDRYEALFESLSRARASHTSSAAPGWVVR